jgi:hypothetical protein
MVKNCRFELEMLVARRGISAHQFLGSPSVGLAGVIERAQRIGSKICIQGPPGGSRTVDLLIVTPMPLC